MSEDATERLTTERVSQVAGTLEEGRTLELELDDGRVVVGRLTQIQTGPHRCPVDGCFRRFDSERAVATHVGKIHPEERFRECPQCGDDFYPTPLDQVYCSKECYHHDGKERLVCEHCQKVFTAKASHADGKRFCSWDCRQAVLGSIEERRCPTCGSTFETNTSNDHTFCSKDCAYEGRENSREERDCPECGGTFEVYPSSDQKFCSTDCYSASHWETKTCPMCGDEFESHAKNRKLAKTYCSHPCLYERNRGDDRPDEPRRLVEGLVDEWDDPETVVGRARAHLGPEWSNEDVHLYYLLVTEADYREAAAAARRLDLDVDEPEPRLVEVARDAASVSTRVTPARFDEAFDEAASVADLGDRLDVIRTSAEQLLRELGLLDEVLRRSGTAHADEVSSRAGGGIDV